MQNIMAGMKSASGIIAGALHYRLMFNAEDIRTKIFYFL
jgi:hypothetical protein